MAEKGNVKETELYPVEQLQKQFQVSDAVHKGVCCWMSWNRGKEVTKKEYAAAVKVFSKGAAGRRENA